MAWEPETRARFEREGAAMLRGVDDPAALTEARRLLDAAEHAFGATVRRLNRDGYSWREIGPALGVSHVGAWLRYGKATDTFYDAAH